MLMKKPLIFLITTGIIWVSLLTFSITGYPSIKLGFGLATGVTKPELVSYNPKFLTELSLGKLAGINTALKSNLEVMAFLGTLIIPFDITYCVEFSIGLETYIGVGMGMVFLTSDFGDQTNLTLNALAGTKFALFSRNLWIFIQSRIKTFPGPGGILQLEIGLIQFLYF